MEKIFEERNKCIFCNSNDQVLLFNKNYESTLSLSLLSSKTFNSHFMPFNILLCNECNTAQIKYIGNLDIVYSVNHLDDYGTTKLNKHKMFTDFIISNNKITGFIEVGSCNGVLAQNILSFKKLDYTIIEPSFTGDNINLKIIPKYLENVNLNEINGNTIIMSDVFEHFYNPLEILEKLKKSENIEYIYLNHPDFDYAVKNDICSILNCEHTFLIEHQFLFSLFEKYGFKLNNSFNNENLSLFLEFKRNNIFNNNKIINFNTHTDIKIFFDNIISSVNKMNIYMENNSDKKFYIWPAAVYSITYLTMGLNYKKLTGILDNSPNKIGKYLYGYNLLCSSLNELLKLSDENICVFIPCASNYINELDLTNTKINIIKLTSL
jgi:hypothetical protein